MRKFLLFGTCFFICSILLACGSNNNSNTPISCDEINLGSYEKNEKIISLLNKEGLKFPVLVKEAVGLYNLNTSMHGIPDVLNTTAFSNGTLKSKGAYKNASGFKNVGEVHVWWNKRTPYALKIAKCIFKGDAKVNAPDILNEFIAKYGRSCGSPSNSFGNFGDIYYLININNNYIRLTVSVESNQLIYSLTDNTGRIQEDINRRNKSEKTTKEIKKAF